MAKKKGSKKSSSPSSAGSKRAAASGNESEEPESGEPRRFEPGDLDWTIVAKPLLKELKALAQEDRGKQVGVIIDLNFKYEGGLSEAKQQTIDLISQVARDLKLSPSVTRVNKAKKELSQQYLFASLEQQLIVELAKRSFYDDQDEPLEFIQRPIFMIWPDFKVRALTMKSVSTVKADAAHRAFAAGGEGIVWAVLDSGVDGDHPHFKNHNNLSVHKLDPPLHHRDFTDPPQKCIEKDRALRETLEKLQSQEAQLRANAQNHQFRIQSLKDEAAKLQGDAQNPQSLSEPAERVAEELIRATEELARMIDELKSVTSELKATESDIRDLEELAALTDEMGHGTHVAGIIAGMRDAKDLPANQQRNGSPSDDDEHHASEETDWEQLRACTRRRDENDVRKFRTFGFERISGMAPRCKILSVKVLNGNGEGPVSNLLAAIAEIQEINEHGRWLKIHGVNLSVGYDFEPEWFACGQSPLCVEVDRLVKSGVVVVAAAGNTGYGYKSTASARGIVASGMMMSINDPGNADLAITVGSTHREMPHMYGVSFFSSKGPTGDGRLKPDLVAPGERIVSCATGAKKDEAVKALKEGEAEPEYAEDSGTSMAAPHVSGAIAAFLSIRREFIGKPEKVKDIFISSATDLKRERYLQGHGLVDLMRAIQSL